MAAPLPEFVPGNRYIMIPHHGPFGAMGVPLVLIGTFVELGPEMGRAARAIRFENVTDQNGNPREPHGLTTRSYRYINYSDQDLAALV